MRPEKRTVLLKELQPIAATVADDENTTREACDETGTVELVGSTALTVSDRLDKCPVLLHELQAVIVTITDNDCSTRENGDSVWVI